MGQSSRIFAISDLIAPDFLLLAILHLQFLMQFFHLILDHPILQNFFIFCLAHVDSICDPIMLNFMSQSNQSIILNILKFFFDVLVYLLLHCSFFGIFDFFGDVLYLLQFAILLDFHDLQTSIQLLHFTHQVFLVLALLDYVFDCLMVAIFDFLELVFDFGDFIVKTVNFGLNLIKLSWWSIFHKLLSEQECLLHFQCHFFNFSVKILEF